MRLIAALLLAVMPSPATAAEPWFVDITDQAGITSLRHGEGVNAVDIDRDGWVDLYLPCVREQGRLLHNLGNGRFKDVTTAAGLTDKGGVGAAIGDLNGDGLADIYVARGADPYVAPNLLLQQTAAGRFENVATAAGVGSSNSGLTVTLADFDRDGDLDAFVPGWGEDKLFRNNGQGSFTLAAAGIDRQGRGWSSLASDFDGDGDLDLLSNHGSYDKPRENHLYRNNGDGSFTEVTAAAGLTNAPWSMGSVSADFDGDGDLDLYVYGYADRGRLYRNDGGLQFTDVTRQSGLSAAKGVGAVTGLIDGDLLPDLALGGFAGPVEIWRNLGEMRFQRVETAGLQRYKRNEGLTLADFDNDGDLDLYVTNVEGNNRLYANTLDNPAYLKVRRGKLSGPLVGATAKLFKDGKQLAVQELQGAVGMAQGPEEWLFRLPNTGPYELEITLPGGRKLPPRQVTTGLVTLD